MMDMGGELVSTASKSDCGWAVVRSIDTEGRVVSIVPKSEAGTDGDSALAVY